MVTPARAPQVPLLRGGRGLEEDEPTTLSAHDEVRSAIPIQVPPDWRSISGNAVEVN
ncbi:hypothetical protein GGP43_002478 [Salinibacter ruber]|nr:hypothetical protein [Salinibacter ruber]